jgi:repressor LexA
MYRSHWSVVFPGLSNKHGIGLIGETPCGPLFPAEEGDLGQLPMDLSAIDIPTTPDMFALRAEGDSMIGAGITHGDVLLIDKREHRSGDIVVVLIGNEVTLKRYLVEKGRHFLRAENPKYPDIDLPADAEVQGVLVGLIRKY